MPLKDKVALRAYQREWDKENRDKVRASHRKAEAERRAKSGPRKRSEEYKEKTRRRSRERYQERRDEYLEAHRVYRLRCPEAKAASQAKWAKNNRGTAGAIYARYRAAKLKAMPAWVNKAAITVFYREASRLTKETGIRHEVDHIVPLQSEIVCGLHVSWNLQIMTRSENARKSNRLAEAA